MLTSVSNTSPRSPDAGEFRPTRWSLVARAVRTGDQAAPEARAAMEEICRDYWYPIYAFARRSGIQPPDAEDLVQGFFLNVIEKGVLTAADPARGRLRTYLLKVFRNHLADEMRKKFAVKRGGEKAFLSLDQAWAEGRFAVEQPSSVPDPEREHDRRWALLMLERALQTLCEERRDAGREEEARVLSPFLSFTTGGVANYEETAQKLDWTVNATRVAVFRLRRRFREILLAMVADTLEEPTQAAIDAEIRELLVALE